MSTNDPDPQQTLAEFREDLDDIRSQLVDIRSKIPRHEVGNLIETVDRHDKEINALKQRVQALENADQTPQ